MGAMDGLLELGSRLMHGMGCQTGEGEFKRDS